MITANPHPLPVMGADARAERPAPRPASLSATVTNGSWRYRAARPSRTVVAISLLVSAGLHAGILFGIARPKPVVAHRQTIDIIPFEISPPQIEQLDDRDVMVRDESDIPNLSPLPPMQPDLPTMPNAGDFVQAIDMTSFAQYTEGKSFNISDHDLDVARNTRIVFNLADLDRVPVPMYQIAPLYPEAMKRAGIAAQVVVDFIVDETGRVLNAVASDSTDREFEHAAVVGVSKWRFQAGMKGGQKVSTRMRVPIQFKMVE